MILMLGGIVDHLDTALTFQGVFLLSWAAVLVTDALVVKKFLKIGPAYYEARQSNLHKWNPVGTVSLIIASVLGTIAALGFMGTFLESTAAFFAAVLASVLTVVIASLQRVHIIYIIMQKIFRKKIISLNSINNGLFRINYKRKRPLILFYHDVVYLLILSNIPTEHNVSVKEDPP